nr:hypothetical protein HCOI_01802100 [Haemonchus contortus]
MNDDNPLIQSVTSTSPSTIIRRYENGDPLESLARVWSCSRCGWLLGLIHIILGVLITLFDLLTSPVTDNSYVISAAILYIICGILCLIATRRVDRCTQLLLMFFASATLLISTAIFIECAVVLNSTCRTEHCDEQQLVMHSILVFISLSEFLTSYATLIVSFVPCMVQLRSIVLIRRTVPSSSATTIS